MHIGPPNGTGSWNFQLLKIQDGGRPPSWKIAISQPGFERFQQNLACRRRSTLLSVRTVKNVIFPKSKMAAAAILKNRKSAISPERFNVCSRNLAYDAQCASEPDRKLKFPTFENARWRTAAILKIENRPLYATLSTSPISRNKTANIIKTKIGFSFSSL